MLPKIATHLFQHTSRVAAAVQNQTSQAIRNALQQVTPTGSTTGSTGLTPYGSVGAGSSWGGSSNAGPGGAKFNAGSRYYSGYTGPGRSLTQANASSAQPDDTEETTVQTIRTKADEPNPPRRARSNSLSFPSSRNTRIEGPILLKVVQMQARHALPAFPSSTSNAIEGQEPPSHSAQSLMLVRQNSTSAQVVDPTLGDAPHPLLVVHSPPEGTTVGSNTTNSLLTEEEDVIEAHEVAAYERLRAAATTRQPRLINQEIQLYRSQGPGSLAWYNLAIKTLLTTRHVGEPITTILELYNEMAHKRNILPNMGTYKSLILALCTRDAEIHRVIHGLERRVALRRITEPQHLGVPFPEDTRLEQLRKEKNYESALVLFEAASTLRGKSLGIPVYNSLLYSCALHSDVDTAVRVFAHLESSETMDPETLPSPYSFYALLLAFYNVGDLKASQQVFEAFKQGTISGRIYWGSSEEVSRGMRNAHMSIWNRMIDIYFKCGNSAMAIELFEAMLSTPSGIRFQTNEPPLPNTLTYMSIISGFCTTGDLESAMRWFNQLLQQSDPPAKDMYQPLVRPTRPRQEIWSTMFETLINLGKIDEMNKLYDILLEKHTQVDFDVSSFEPLVYHTNMKCLLNPELGSAQKAEYASFVSKRFISTSAKTMFGTHYQEHNVVSLLAAKLIEGGRSDDTISLLENLVKEELQIVADSEANGSISASEAFNRMNKLRDAMRTFAPSLFSLTTLPNGSSLHTVLRIVALGYSVGIAPAKIYAQKVAELYENSTPLERSELSSHDQQLLLKAFIALELPSFYDGDASVEAISPESTQSFDTSSPLATLLSDLCQTGFDLKGIEVVAQRKMLRALIHSHGLDKAREIITGLGPKFASLLNVPGLTAPGLKGQLGYSIPDLAASADAENVRVDLYHTRFVNEWFPMNPNVTLLMAYDRYASGVAQNVYPSPECMARLISGFGRLGDMPKVRELYQAAQLVLSALKGQKRWQQLGWYTVEVNMVVGLAHAGDHEGANLHRRRVLEAGGTPTADAYGALIASVKDTTDDAACALSYWEEARAHGIKPHVYLYNTMISKLSKARKAEHAFSLLRQMIEEGIHPTAVTYGAIIAAACRVGDCASAEAYFEDMTALPNYKPRSAPYNTMIQLYIYTKPDRERALYYYNRMLQSNIVPTDYTYKLLLEMYGKTEPVDLEAMQKVFDEICQSSTVDIQGSHWATLVTVYGCTAKDLDRAIGIFESIATHPSTARAKTSLPDAIVYEALFNVLSFHHRQDLIPSYIRRLEDTHIRPTAYVLNAVIRGYAAAGDIESARAIFERMEDPAIGKAAPYNRPGRSPQGAASEVDAEGSHIVYREPSTWEAMVRAELGAGERERAVELIQRMESRMYPELVVQRVRDILQAPSSPSLLSDTAQSPGLSHDSNSS